MEGGVPRRPGRRGSVGAGLGVGVENRLTFRNCSNTGATIAGMYSNPITLVMMPAILSAVPTSCSANMASRERSA